jgi:transposase InsO family protein
VVDALSMALARRRPAAGLLAHSDRGSQYASEHYQRALGEEGIVCGMSGVGQCRDNAPMESFFGRLKCAVAPDGVFTTRDQARAVIFEYLEVFYFYCNRFLDRSSSRIILRSSQEIRREESKRCRSWTRLRPKSS